MMPPKEQLASEHQRETAFLRHLIRYDNTAERDRLEGRITQIQRDERCIRRGVWLMALLTAVGVVGYGYAAILLEDFPQNKSQLILKVFGALGLGSLISLLAFASLWGVYRAELDRRREECRRLVTTLLETRLGQPQTVPVGGAVKQQESNGSERIRIPA
jgi:hypothetical protein